MSEQTNEMQPAEANTDPTEQEAADKAGWLSSFDRLRVLVGALGLAGLVLGAIIAGDPKARRRCSSCPRCSSCWQRSAWNGTGFAALTAG